MRIERNSLIYLLGCPEGIYIDCALRGPSPIWPYDNPAARDVVAHEIARFEPFHDGRYCTQVLTAHGWSLVGDQSKASHPSNLRLVPIGTGHTYPSTQALAGSHHVLILPLTQLMGNAGIAGTIGKLCAHATSSSRPFSISRQLCNELRITDDDCCSCEV